MSEVGENSLLEVSVKFRDMEVKFSGNYKETIRSFFGFLSKILPAYELVSDLILTIDLEKLLKSVTGLMAFTPEGTVLTVSREVMGGEKNAILMNLVKTYIGYQTGRLEKDFQLVSEIISSTGSKPGTIAARLSELTNIGWVERVGRGEYRITTLGVKSFLDEVLPRIKKEMNEV